MRRAARFWEQVKESVMGYPVLAAGGPLFDAWQAGARAAEIQHLAARVARCADDADAALAQLGRVQMGQWQSPAGRAYRNALAGRMTELRRARDALREASVMVMRQASTAAGTGY